MERSRSPSAYVASLWYPVGDGNVLGVVESASNTYDFTRYLIWTSQNQSVCWCEKTMLTGWSQWSGRLKSAFRLTCSAKKPHPCFTPLFPFLSPHDSAIFPHSRLTSLIPAQAGIHKQSLVSYDYHSNALFGPQPLKSVIRVDEAG